MIRLLTLGGLLVVLSMASAQDTAKPKLLIAFATYKDRPKHPQIHFYEHDAVAKGKLVGAIDTVANRSDNRPSLSLDGRWCVFASELENQTSRIFVWDMKEKKLLALPALNDSPNSQQQPWISGKGDVLAFAAWDRAGASNRWDVLLYDLPGKKMLDRPAFNSFAADERMPAFSGDGRFLAYASNAKGGAGLTDIHLYDLAQSKAISLGDMNGPGMDLSPSLSGDGRLIAFASDRPGGAGGRDIYLYDRHDKRFLPLPGLNSAAHEQTPALSADGRYLAFVSERIKGEGERDIFLYDRQSQQFLPTPGLNSRREDIDPFVLVLPES
jgi:Tol biopolymer transport system component